MTENIPRKQYIAKIIQIVTVPSVMVVLLLTLLFTVRSDIFSGAGPFVLAVVFLAGIPILAYPLSALIPSVREKGRDGRRKLAFVTNFIGYSLALIYGHICSITGSMLLAIYYLGWLCLIPCVILFAVIAWASLVLKRHTWNDMLTGGLSAGLAFGISWLIC